MLQGMQNIPDTVRDTAVVKTPLPGGLGAFTRWAFNLPSWIQIGGAIVGFLVACVIAWWLWQRRQAIWTWLVTRSRGVKIALATVVALVFASVAAVGVVGWNFMQHNNDFCASCHVMTVAYSRFQHSEHRKLQCHDCHQQSIFASMRQLVIWVAEKPQDIGMHAKVPNDVCATCHIKGPGQDSVWKNIVGTAGHRLHLHSDSASLRNLQCVTCHGAEVHRFVPVDVTCGQAGCHNGVQINFAKMRDQTSLHCVKCHQFTVGVSETISLDSTRKFLLPDVQQCFSCHNDMQKRMGNFVPEKDPHQAVCGACHNPHKQMGPKEAWQTCTNSGCHANPVTLTPLHKGVTATALANCETCHKAHAWSVSAEMCLTCHKNIYSDPPPRMRTTMTRGDSTLLASYGADMASPATLVSAGSQTAELPRVLKTVPAQLQAASVKAQAAPATVQPTMYGGQRFRHSLHRGVECLACHNSGKPHGELKIKTITDCQACHHASPATTAKGAVAGTPPRACTDCHAPAGAPRAIRDSVVFKLSVWKEPRTRVLDFRHDQHSAVSGGCLTCHGAAPTLALPADKNCTSCHDRHHDPSAQCRFCHASPKPAHTRDAHVGCAGSQCHATQTVQSLQAKRNVCLVCHQTLVSHNPGRECAGCHQVQWLPAQVRTN